jgi:hypothetical protein
MSNESASVHKVTLTNMHLHRGRSSVEHSLCSTKLEHQSHCGPALYHEPEEKRHQHSDLELLTIVASASVFWSKIHSSAKSIRHRYLPQQPQMELDCQIEHVREYNLLTILLESITWRGDFLRQMRHRDPARPKRLKELKEFQRRAHKKC